MILSWIKSLLIFVSLSSVCAHRASADPCAILDFHTAWLRVISFAPVIGITQQEIAIKDAERWQVSFRPNPVVEVDAENLGVHNRNDTAEPPQTTFAISQILELGGKRKARIDFANSQTDLAFLDSQIAIQNLLFELKEHFIQTKIAEEKLHIASNRLAVSEKIVEAVRCQISAGAVSPIQEKKAQIAKNAAQIAVNDALSLFIQSKKQLSAMWGNPCPDFETVDLDLFHYPVPPDECCVVQSIIHTCDFAKAKQEIYSATQSLKLQKVNGIPDVNISFGYRIFNDSNQHGWVVGAQMPIPFNRNQGNIKRARATVNQTEFQLEEVVRTLTEKTLVVYQRLVASFQQSEMMKSGVLADAMETYQLTETGYNQGKLEYLDLLDSQRLLFESQEKFLDVLSTYHLSKAELERLSGEYNSTSCDL